MSKQKGQNHAFDVESARRIVEAEQNALEQEANSTLMHLRGYPTRSHRTTQLQPGTELGAASMGEHIKERRLATRLQTLPLDMKCFACLRYLPSTKQWPRAGGLLCRTCSRARYKTWTMPLPESSISEVQRNTGASNRVLASVCRRTLSWVMQQKRNPKAHGLQRTVKGAVEWRCRIDEYIKRK